jgi:uncharacterized membrane protein
MVMLYAAAAAFLGIHLLIAGTRVRDAITGTIGKGPYLGLFSAASIGAIAWLVIAYNGAQAGAENTTVFDLGADVRHLAIPVVFLAFLLGVPGLMMANPTSVGQGANAAKSDVARGVLRITRHPFLWGVAIWSAMHLAMNGDLASVLLFGTFLILALFGTVSIDAKRKRKLGEQWAPFARATSNVPFVAILTGRNSFKAGEYFDWRLFLTLAIFAAALLAHARAIGVSPFPGGWVPF